MKRSVKLVIAAVLVFVLALSGIGAKGAYAAEKGTTDAQKYNSNTYRYIVEDFSRRVDGSVKSVNVECYSMRLELTGYGKAGKKINKQLKSIITVDPDQVFGYAESDADEFPWEETTTYYDRVNSWVTFNNGKYLSLTVSRDTWFGGVENTFLTGYTFSLKTGKPVPITKATGWSLEQIKKRISDNMLADGDEYDENSFKYLDGMKESDFRYYLKDANTCIVTFGPYELGYGGWSRTFEIEF